MEIIEKELKFLFCEENFQKIHQYFIQNQGQSKAIYQVNYYLENNEFILGKNHLSVRIRMIENEKFEFTIKIKLPNNEENLRISKEITIDLKSKTAEALINGDYLINYPNLYNELTKCINSDDKLENIKVIGSLSTYRTIFNMKDLGMVCLDENEYYNCKDFELEWECENTIKARKILLNIFNELDIKPIDGASYSKKNRFLKKYEIIINN